MLVTLISSLFGLLGSMMPDILKYFQDQSDKKHELLILDMQLQQAQQGHLNRLEEINANADISETKSLYKTFNVGIRWVDALNGTVRPVIAYAFFGLYGYLKIQQAIHTPWNVWTEADQAIFSAIISFYYGKRQLNKVFSR